jgi:PAS domain S-box-containing protein
MASEAPPRPAAWPPGGGEMGALIRAYDWATTPLGPPARWPQSLRTAVDVCLGSAFASFVWWGPELVQLYNDPALGLVRAGHPAALGAPARAAWAAAWATVGPLAERVLGAGGAGLAEDLALVPDRGGAPEAAAFTCSYGALRDEAGAIAGLFITAVETTARVQAEAALRESEARLRLALDAAEMGTFVWHPADDRGEPDARMLALFGLDAGGTLSLAAALATMIHPGDRGRYAAAVARALDPAGAGALREDLRVRRPDGAERWLTVTAQVAFAGAPPRAVRMVGTAADVTERKRLEAERGRLAVAEAVAAERQALLRRVVALQEEERRRVAHEVHDGVTQLAAAAALRLDGLAERLAPGLAADDLRDLERARDLARRAAADARRLIAGLRPEALDALGLAGAVGQEVEALRAAGRPVDLEDGELVGVRLDPEAEITLYRVAQEALANVRKHARAGRIDIELRRWPDALHLDVRDDGIGLPLDEGRGRRGLGLLSMRERARLVGGTCAIESVDDRGTRVRVTLPLPTAG